MLPFDIFKIKVSNEFCTPLPPRNGFSSSKVVNSLKHSLGLRAKMIDKWMQKIISHDVADRLHSVVIT